MIGLLRCVVILVEVFATGGLSGCCFECLPPIAEKFIELAFPVDSVRGTGFSRVELRTVYLIFYNQPGFRGTTDTMRQLPGGQIAMGQDATYYLNLYPKNTTPAMTFFSVYAQPGTPFSYRIVVPATGRVYEIDHVSETYTDPERGCSCRYVKEKLFTLDGQPQVQPINSDKAATVLYR